MPVHKSIWLIRHGTTAHNAEGLMQGWLDIPLSPQGHAQARNLALALAKEPLDTLYVSPLTRARETAAPVLEGHDLKPLVDERLREVHLGDWEGKRFQDEKMNHPEFVRAWRSDPSIPFPRGESFLDLCHRTASLAAEILASPSACMAIVGHSAINRALMANLLMIPPQSARAFTMANGALSLIRMAGDAPGDRHPILEFWNRIPAPEVPPHA